MKRLIFLILICFCHSSVAGDPPITGIFKESSWDLIGEVDGYKVYSRKMPKSQIMGFKIEGVLKAPIENIIANIRHVESSSKWMPNLIKKITLKEISDKEAITYSINDFPWPFNDRDFILHNKLHLHREKKLLYVLSKSVEHSAYPPGEKLVRAVVGYSNMGLRPAFNNPNYTYFVWSIYGDPRGNIPSWVVNFFQKGFPVDFFHATEERSILKKRVLLPGLQKMVDQLKVLIKKGNNESQANL
ncbi:MAG: hypothetical protein HN509_01570 [Halobacteriovoraceae bacterium]|jgi:hypothetical protein|nr:hypothetical protein [Halobacteriovoraceae bacterium]MBT5095737.1 hypothetical protein [Halobacteriovoraceae bacterium]